MYGRSGGKFEIPLLFCVASLALGTLQHMHLPAERNDRNNKKEYEESHTGFLNELGLGPTYSAAHQFCCNLGTPEKNLGSDDEHSRASVLRPLQFDNTPLRAFLSRLHTALCFVPRVGGAYSVPLCSHLFTIWLAGVTTSIGAESIPWCSHPSLRLTLLPYPLYTQRCEPNRNNEP
jgi:hypothetical protein